MLLLIVLVLVALAVLAARRREGFCPAGWTNGDGECSKTFSELRCSAAMNADGRLEFGAGCSRYARDTITRSLKN